jgi:hypothetical protein
LIESTHLVLEHVQDAAQPGGRLDALRKLLHRGSLVLLANAGNVRERNESRTDAFCARVYSPVNADTKRATGRGGESDASVGSAADPGTRWSSVAPFSCLPICGADGGSRQSVWRTSLSSPSANGASC